MACKLLQRLSCHASSEYFSVNRTWSRESTYVANFLCSHSNHTSWPWLQGQLIYMYREEKEKKKAIYIYIWWDYYCLGLQLVVVMVRALRFYFFFFKYYLPTLHTLFSSILFLFPGLLGRNRVQSNKSPLILYGRPD